jgi:hypothetical protein
MEKLFLWIQNYMKNLGFPSACGMKKRFPFSNFLQEQNYRPVIMQKKNE